MDILIIFGIVLFVTPLILLIQSWKALLAYVLIIGFPLTWLWINHFYVTSQPDYVASNPGSGLGYLLMWGFTFFFVLGITLSILSIGLYKMIRYRYRR